eukprot:m.239082 g.239082  ORF g.239082 m.239082 type:complete len:505 (-) comp15291_c0_seq3:50-1564(-)
MFRTGAYELANQEHRMQLPDKARKDVPLQHHSLAKRMSGFLSRTRNAALLSRGAHSSSASSLGTCSLDCKASHQHLVGQHPILATSEHEQWEQTHAVVGHDSTSAPASAPSSARGSATSLLRSLGTKLKLLKKKKPYTAESIRPTAKRLERKLSVRPSPSQVVASGILHQTDLLQDTTLLCSLNTAPMHQTEATLGMRFAQKAKKMCQKQDVAPLARTHHQHAALDKRRTKSTSDMSPALPSTPARIIPDESSCSHDSHPQHHHKHDHSSAQSPSAAVYVPLPRSSAAAAFLIDELFRDDTSSSESDSVPSQVDSNAVAAAAALQEAIDQNPSEHRLAVRMSLRRKLERRPSTKELTDRNILPQQKLQDVPDKQQIAQKLERQLSLRSDKQQLMDRNVLPSLSEDERHQQATKVKTILKKRLSQRSSVKELKQRKILKFDAYAEVAETWDVESYDRSGERPWMYLTDHDKVCTLLFSQCVDANAVQLGNISMQLCILVFPCHCE